MSTTITRQGIVDAVETRMKTILTTSGYYTNIGSNTFVWKSTSYKAEQLPAVDIEDSSEMIDDDAEDESLEVHTLSLSVFVVASYGTSAEQIRQAMEDVRKAVNVDKTWGNLARRTWQTGSEMGVEQNAEKIIGARLDFQIEYVTLKLSEQ